MTPGPARSAVRRAPLTGRTVLGRGLREDRDLRRGGGVQGDRDLQRGGTLDGRFASSRVAEMQRSRLLAAAAAAVDELGYVRTAVADVTRRARVSRRTFYEQFANRDECLAAVLDEVVARVAREIAQSADAGRPWRERVRVGLWTILAFLDREPVLARVCVVQALRGGSELLERREQVLAQFAAVVDEGRVESARGAGPTPLTAEGVVGAAFAIVHARLLRREGSPLAELLNELMGMIVLPYRGLAAARRELARPAPVPPRRASLTPAPAQDVAQDPLEGVSMRLTYRTARVLEGIAARPGASNREVAERAGIQDPGQISKLLARLRGLGLLTNSSHGHARGEPNAWRLTPLGERVIERLCLASQLSVSQQSDINACVAPGSASTLDPEEK